MKILALILRLGLGGLWIYAGVMKLRDPQMFFEDIRNFRMTSSDVSMLMAIYLPWLETITGAALVTRKLVMGASLLSSLMAVIFLVALGSAWARGLDITCGCLGHDETNRTNYPLHVALDAVLLAVSVLLLSLEARPRASVSTESADASKR
jgi:uncharacterized membrane protein YphA (DoxX/SURF4 family)